MAEEHEKAQTHVQKSMPKAVFQSATLWQVITILAICLVAISVFTKGFSGFSTTGSGNDLTAQQAEAKAVAYINSLLQGQATVQVTNITESNGLYNMNFTIGGQPYSSYMTKDGSLLFPAAYDMKASTNPATNSSTPSNSSATSGYPKSDTPVVDFFVMSFCPYGQQAEAGLIGAWQTLGSVADFVPHYVIYSNYQSAQYCLDANMTYCSMHGAQEVHEDVRQMCIWKYYNASTWWNYVSKINSQCSSTNVDVCWLIAANGTAINTTKISECQANEAVALLEPERALNEELGVSGSPTVFINGKTYSGARSADAYKSAVCSAFSTAPSACGQVLNSTETAATGGCGG